MFLVDTSVWIDHLKTSDPRLVEVLEQNFVSCHAFIRGELALGSLKNRIAFVAQLALLPQIPIAKDEEVMAMIEQHALFSQGIGYVDAHLLAAALLHGQVKIWTHDKRFKAIAYDLGVGAHPVN